MKNTTSQRSTYAKVHSSRQKMIKILQDAISALGDRSGSTKLDILSYIKSEQPMLSYPNTHNLVFYLRRAINDAIDNKILYENSGKYKLVSANKKQINREASISERSRSKERNAKLTKRFSRHRRSHTRTVSLTPVGSHLDIFITEPHDRRRKRSKKRHSDKKRRGGAKRRKRRRKSDHGETSEADSSQKGDAVESKQVPNNGIESQAAEKEKDSSNPESDQVPSADDSNNFEHSA